MAKVELDLQKLSTLDKEIAILTKKKNQLEKDIEAGEKIILKKEIESEKSIRQKEEELKTKINNETAKLTARENDLDKREKQIKKQEEELEIIHKEAENLKKSREAFSYEQKEIDKIRASLLDTENLLKLKIKQYEDKLKELEDIKK